jgi:hypothetical protein
LEPNSEKRELREVSIAGVSMWASPVGAGVATTTGAGATGASALAGFEALVALGVEAGTETGTGAGADSAAEEEEAFFAIVVGYTLIGEVFLSIFRDYILYFILNMQ